MEIILHVGAHRTATTSFQQYVRSNLDTLQDQKVGFWGPRRTRRELFCGLYPGPAVANRRNLQRRAEGRIKMHTTLAGASGLRQLIVSEENMIGAPRDCLRRTTLYPSIGERMARVTSAFNGRVARVVLGIRSQDLWWSSIAAYSVGKGHRVPGYLSLEQMAHNPRTWRDVITDLACAVPGAEILVMPFEQYVGRPNALLSVATGNAAPKGGMDTWVNRSPDLRDLRNALQERGEDPQKMPDGHGRWNPFTTEQATALREAYADDMMWLTAGADGLAKLTVDDTDKRAGKSAAVGGNEKGHDNDQGQEHLARSG